MTGEWWLEEIDSQTEFSFWCLFAAPLFVATDVFLFIFCKYTQMTRF
jgi:hypothetical protein